VSLDDPDRPGAQLGGLRHWPHRRWADAGARRSPPRGAGGPDASPGCALAAGPREQQFPGGVSLECSSRGRSMRLRVVSFLAVLVCAVPAASQGGSVSFRSEEHTSELQSLTNLVCRLLLEKKQKST